jgi:ribosome biogenesis protein Nip4
LIEFLKNFGAEIKYEKIRNEYFEILPGMEKYDGIVVSKGLTLGVQKKNFKPSLYLLEKLSKISDNKLFINDKAEWLFLCGRDVFLDNIVEDNSSNKLFLVQNCRDENLGLGMKKGKLILNIIDRGDFLRREK